MPPILDMVTHMLMAMLPMFLSAPVLVLTQSLRDLILSPRELFLTMVLAIMVTTTARDPLMPSLRLMLMPPILVTDILMPLELMAMPMFPLDPVLVLTQSLRDLIL